MMAKADSVAARIDGGKVVATFPMASSILVMANQSDSPALGNKAPPSYRCDCSSTHGSKDINAIGASVPYTAHPQSSGCDSRSRRHAPPHPHAPAHNYPIIHRLSLWCRTESVVSSGCVLFSFRRQIASPTGRYTRSVELWPKHNVCDALSVRNDGSGTLIMHAKAVCAH